jgi:hypothetical protein
MAPRWATTNIDSVAPLPAWLNCIVTRPNNTLTFASTRQRFPILHIARDRVEFNKDHCPPCTDQERKSLPSFYFIVFSLPNIYVQIRLGVTLAWSSAPTSCHDQVTLVAWLPAWLSTDIASWLSHLGSAVASMTRYRHHATIKLPWQRHRQHDSTSTSHCGQVTSVATSLAWLGINIAPRPSRLCSIIASMTRH